MESVFRGIDISATGLAAEWKRMEVTANNVANAETTQTADGGPYRRRRVVFSTALDEMAGVQIKGVERDQGPPRLLFDPSHPDANPETGYVAMPNIQLPMEMVDLMSAGRAYEANLTAMRNFKQIAEETIRSLRG
jgi:flagellar basal-body rod protein FlgC